MYIFHPKTTKRTSSPSATTRLQSSSLPAYPHYVQGHGGGPKTRAGKAASSRNAVMHGLTASAPVVRQVELIDDCEHHLRQVIASVRRDHVSLRSLAAQ